MLVTQATQPNSMTVIFQALQDNQDGISSVEAIPYHSCISWNRNNIREPWWWSVTDNQNSVVCGKIPLHSVVGNGGTDQLLKHVVHILV